MANEVSKIKLPNNNTTYIIKDTVARDYIKAINLNGYTLNGANNTSSLVNLVNNLPQGCSKYVYNASSCFPQSQGFLKTVMLDEGDGKFVLLFTGLSGQEYRLELVFNQSEEGYCWVGPLSLSNHDTPDVNLIMEYSTWCGDSNTGEKNELGLGGICYIGNGRYVFYLRNSKNTEGTNIRANQGRLVCISMLWDSTEGRYIKKFIWRTEAFKGYHGNSLTYVPSNSTSGTIYGVYCQEYYSNNGTQKERYKKGWFKFTSVSNTSSNAPSSLSTSDVIEGANIAYDSSLHKFIGGQGTWSASTNTKGRLNIYTGEPGSDIQRVIDLANENADNKEILNLINNGWYQGCHAEKGIFYQLYWRTYSVIVAYDLATGKFIRKWQLPRFSNLCKVMDEIQDITYNFDTGHFIINSKTDSIRIHECPIVNISQVGLYKPIPVAVPARNFVREGSSDDGFYTNSIYTARIELGVNSNDSPSLNPNQWRNDCTPCCDRLDNQGNVRLNFFRSLKDADYAFENYHPGGGKIKYIITNAFSTSVTSAYAHFFKNCIITTQSGKTLTLNDPFFETCDFAFIQGVSSSSKIVINGTGGSGYSNQSVIRIQDGSQLILENVNFTGVSGMTYGVYVTNYGKLKIGQDVTVSSPVTRVSNNMMTCTPVFTPASGVAVSAQTWKKVDGVVTGDLTLTVNSSFAANGSKTIGTMSVGSRPDHTIIGNTRTGSVFMRSSITSSGTVTFATASSIAANTTIYATFNYVSS